MKKKIYVTQDHIDAANFMLDRDADWRNWFPRYECCPIALALKTQGFPDAQVGVNGRMVISKKDSLHYMQASKRVKNFVAQFDDYGTGEPFSFFIELYDKP